MSITIHRVEESTLADWLKSFNVRIVVCAPSGTYGWRAIVKEAITEEVGYGPSAGIAVKNLAKRLSGAPIMTCADQRSFAPVFTGIYAKNDWESFTVQEAK